MEFHTPMVNTNPRGGAATANGLHYQLLWSLLTATTLAITDSKTNAGQLSTATLMIEPANGGDLQVEGARSREVIQLKARTTGNPWSLTELTKEVLPDLYKAANQETKDTKYIFVTEGPMGKWENVYRFFQSLKHRDPNRGIHAALDNSRTINFNHRSPNIWNEEQTEHTIFNDIAKYLQQRQPKNTRERIATVRQRLWELLKNFEFRTDDHNEQLQRRIDGALSEVIDHQEDIPNKRQELIGALLDLASQGPITITPDKFLAEHGLDAIPLSRWNIHRVNAAKELTRILKNTRYDQASDCRSGLAHKLLDNWQDKAFLVITGKPGVGKTWALNQLGKQLLNEPGLPILLHSRGNTDTDLQKAADTYWQNIAGHDNTISLTRLTRRWNDKHQGRSRHRQFILLLDNVQDPGQAQNLIRETAGIPELRVAITSPPTTAQAIQETVKDNVTIHELDDFTWRERDRLLSHHLGSHRIDIPPDVEDLLCNPFLAGSYCTIAKDDPTWQPINEYELLQRFWEQATKGPGAEPHDSTTLQALALDTFNGGTHPWTGTQLQDAGANDDRIARLERSGWLQQDDRDHYRFTHDRFLSYAAAKALAEQHYSKEISTEELAKTFTNLLENPTINTINFGYVLMDLLWNLLNNEQGAKATAEILAAADQADYQTATALYDDLLPTLGERVTPALFKRLKTGKDSESQHRVVTAINRLPTTTTTTNEATLLLDNDDPLLMRAGLRILTQHPTPAALTKLWKLHQEMQEEPEKYGGKENARLFLYRESFEALKAAVKLNHEWLKQAIKNADPTDEPVHDLAFLVANLHDNGVVWQQVKQMLKSKIPTNKIRAIALCIRVHQDQAEEAWLKENLNNIEDLTGQTALDSLAVINPDEALKALPNIPLKDLLFTRNWYLPLLRTARPQQTINALHNIITKSENPLFAARIIDDVNVLRNDTLCFLLERLAEAIKERIKNNDPKQPVLYHALDQLSKTYRPDLLEALNQHQDLENQLVTLLTTTINGTLSLCDDLGAQKARKLLFLIGGKGWVTVNNQRTRHERQYERVIAIEKARKRPTNETIKLLVEISQETQPAGKHPFEQSKAAESLAALGETTSVIDAVVKHGLRTSYDLNRLVTAPRPFDDNAIATALTNPDSPGTPLALGIAGRTDHTPTILNTLQKNTDEEIVSACIIALGYLQNGQPAVLTALTTHLNDPAFAQEAKTAMVRIGTDNALDALRSHQPNDEKIAVTILTYHPESTEAFNTLQRAIDDLRTREAQDLLHEAIANLPDDLIAKLVRRDSVASFLRKQVKAREGGLWFVGTKYRACKAFALVDPDTAFAAAFRALKDERARDRQLYPYLLVKLDTQSATNELLQLATTKQSKQILFAVGRALANVPDAEKIILDLIRANDAQTRENACILASRRQPGIVLLEELRRAVFDPVSSVGAEAVNALDECEKKDCLRSLIEELPDADYDRQWLILDVLLRHGDPGDIGGPRLPWQCDLDVLPEPMLFYSEDDLRKRRKKLADKLKRQ